ncbi:perforin-1-like [Aulostomus maculatus]
MSLLSICVCAGLLLSLPPATRPFCSKGTPKNCQEAEFAPGSTLAGEGFDITRLERKGAFVLDMNQWMKEDKTCTLCVNPFLENRKEKLPLAVEDWRPSQLCKMKVRSSLYRSSESLVSSSSSAIENNWGLNLDVNVGARGASLMLAGTTSKLAEYSMEKTKNDKYSFASQSLSCAYYSYRLSQSPILHRDFKKLVTHLPKIYTPQNKQRFYKLMDIFGTHYITKVKVGGYVHSVTSIQQCQASLQGLSTEEVGMCLEVEANANFKATVKSEMKRCKKDSERTESKASFSSLFSDRFTEIRGGQTTEPDLLFSADKNPAAYKEWLDTLPHKPDIISYSLESLHELLPENTPVRKNLRAAISHYILEKGVWRNCSSGCQTGIKSSPRHPCVCQCHNDPAVNLDCCPTRRGMARVIITVQRASGLWGDHTTATDGFVKVFFNKQLAQRSPVIANNNNPHWAMTIDLGSHDLSMGNKVRFEVWDQDSNWDDDLLGQCEVALSAGVKEDLCILRHGRLFYKWEVRCAPSLGGELCMDYQPSPMSPSLKSLYVSRHAHPVPKSVLLKMGVFENETSPQRNRSYTAGSHEHDVM